MKKRLLRIGLVLALCLNLLSGTVLADSGKIVIGGLDSNVWFTKYGNVYTDCSTETFQGAMGFSQGDLVTVKFLDQELVLPVVPTYSYVDSGKPAIIAGLDEAGEPTGYLALAINMGNFAETYGLAVKKTDADGNWYWEAVEGVTYPVEVSFEMSKKGGYMAEYLLHELNRTNNREDYAALSDAAFANFRNIATTGMGDGVLYRTSSPINPELSRNTYAMNALKAAGVTVIMNLADSQELAQTYEGFTGSYYAGQNVAYLNLGVDFAAKDFQSGLAKGLRFFAENKGVYAVHCTEGKDRAGFVAALLECLMGASFDEVVADYMQTYSNYYGVAAGSEKYQAIADSNIIKSLSTAFGVTNLSKANLSREAEEYIRSIGLSGAEIRALKANLSADMTAESVENAKTFDDVHGIGHWATDAIDFVVAQGIFGGTSDNTFNPNGSMTRQAMWMVLSRMSGKAPANMDEAKAWAVEAGISDGSDPSGAVTRQQFVAMLWRWAKSQNMDVSAGENTNILSYEDASVISEYAIAPFQWACGDGVLNGYADGTLRPQATATRAHVAKMLMNFMSISNR